MTAPSIPRCGRLDDHDPHTWTRQPRWWESPRTYPCPGVVVTEMSACHHCRQSVAACRCEEEYVAEMNANYWEGDPDA